jgi:hypothetical protein
MNVKIYDIDADTGAETFRCVAFLADALPTDDDEYGPARDELSRVGRYWIGGGAAPLVLLVRAGEGV